MFKKSEKFFDIIGEILAVVLVLVYVVLILNANFSFIPEGVFLNILEILRTYGSLILVGVVGLEAMSKRNLVFQIIFIALLALIVVFLFFPGTYENLINPGEMIRQAGCGAIWKRIADLALLLWPGHARKALSRSFPRC